MRPYLLSYSLNLEPTPRADFWRDLLRRYCWQQAPSRQRRRLKAASGNAVLADQRRGNGFSAPFKQCNIAVQPALLVGVAHHTQLQGRARFEQLGDLIQGGF